jgi:tRNA (guanine37-N1)-methyltransferase
MRIDIITIHPQLLSGPLDHSILKRAQDKGLVEIHIHDLRQWSEDKHNRVDDYQFGGGAGMVMRIEPIFKCIAALKAERDYDEVIYMTPDGPTFAQPTANRLSTMQNIMILCGHYKGVDDRVRQHLITREISIGEYVLTGGELPAVVVCDAIIRLIPGVISDETSALFDSHQDGLLAPPVYTRPAEYNGWSVPEVLLSGNDRLIEEWRMNQAIERTKERRPGMLED